MQNHFGGDDTGLGRVYLSPPPTFGVNPCQCLSRDNSVFKKRRKKRKEGWLALHLWCWNSWLNFWGGDVAQLVRALDHHAYDIDSIPWCSKGFFLPESTFSADSLAVSVHLPCAFACFFICVHVKDPVVLARVRWIMETLKHSACTVGLVAQLCCSWLSSEKATRISHGRNPIGTIQL